MTPTTIALIVSLVEEFIKETPALAADLQAIFSNPNPTPADWQALREKVAGKDYAAFVPQSDLDPSKLESASLKESDSAPSKSAGTVTEKSVPVDQMPGYCE